MKRFWQSIPIPPRQRLVQLGLLAALFLVMVAVGGRERTSIKPGLADIEICGGQSEQHKWFSFVDKYLGTRLAEAQLAPCAELTAQCQGPFDGYPGYTVQWRGDPLGIARTFKIQVARPGFEFVRPSGGIQAASRGFQDWGSTTVNRITGGTTWQELFETSTNTRVDDDAYYRVAVHALETGRSRCACPQGIADCGVYPHCFLDRGGVPDYSFFRRTRDFSDARYGVPVTAADCPWRQRVTPEVDITCGSRKIYTSDVTIQSSGRPGAAALTNEQAIANTDWFLEGGEVTFGPRPVGPPISTQDPYGPYVFQMEDGSQVAIDIRRNEVWATRTGGPCDPGEELTCSLSVTVGGIPAASWRNTIPSGPPPVLNWNMSPNFTRGSDVIRLGELDISVSPPAERRNGSSNDAGAFDLSTVVNGVGLPRVFPADSPLTLRYTGKVESTDGSKVPGFCETTLRIEPELPPNCVGDCSPRLLGGGVPSCNSVALRWDPQPTAVKYRIRTYDAGGAILRTDHTNPPDTNIVIFGLPDNTSYRFTMQVIDALGNVSPDEYGPITVNLPACGPLGFPSPPPTLTLTPGPSCTQMQLSWTDSSNETSYEVYRTDRGAAPIATLGPSATSPVTHADSGLNQRTEYSYYVKAINASGSSTSNTVSAATTACPGSDFRIDVTPDAGVTVRPGETANYTVTIIPDNLPNTDINLSVAGLPAGATPSFGSNPVRTPASGNVATALRVETVAGTPAGTYTLIVNGSASGLPARTDTVNLVVETGVGPNNPPSASGGAPTSGLMCSLPPLLTFAFTYTDPDSPPDPAAWYQLQIDSDAGFAAPIIVDRPVSLSMSPPVLPSGGTATQLVEVRAGGCPGGVSPNCGILDYDRPYYWRVKVRDSRGAESAWMSGVSFTSPTHAYPQPDFRASATAITSGTPIDFNDDSVIAAGYTIARWLWNFGSNVQSATVTAPPSQPADEDGNPNNNTVTQSPPPNRTQPHVTYSAAGAKTVSLSVRDSSGFECTRTKTLFGGSGTNLNWREIIPQ